MTTQMVRRQDWSAIFDPLSRQYAGEPAAIEVLEEATEARELARGLPFAGISFEQKVTDGAIANMLGDSRPDGHITHRIHTPSRVTEERE